MKQNSIRTRARTQAVSLIGRRNLPNRMRRGSAELGRSSNGAALGVSQNTLSYEIGRLVSGVNEGICDVLNDEVTLRVIVYFPICRVIQRHMK